MDRSNFRRPDRQKQRQTTKISSVSSRPVIGDGSERPRQFVDAAAFRPRPQSQVRTQMQIRPNPRPIMPEYRRQTVAVRPHAPAPSQIATVYKRPPIDMDLPEGDSPSTFKILEKKARRRKIRQFLSRSAAVTMVLVITLGGLLVSQSYFKANKVFRGGAGTAAALKDNVDPDMLKGEGRGRVNVLLLGRGGGSHDAPDLTDTIMVASIDPVNHTATLLSVPRDLWVNVDNHGVMKLNAAWQAGVYSYLGRVTPNTTDTKAVQAGFKVVDGTVEQVLGINIDYNVLVDFQAFKQAVDSVGGVSVNVPSDLIDPTMAWENGGNSVLAKAGIQDFDGTQALIYARSRETTSDFARAERQRAILVALKGRAQSVGTLTNPAKLSGLINAFGNNVQTDLSIGNASRLFGIIKNISDINVNSVSLAGSPDQTQPGALPPYVTTGNMNGQSIVLPKAGLFKYDDIHDFVSTQLKDPYVLKEKAKIVVFNGTAIPGLADKKANELKIYGYNIVRTGNMSSDGWLKTTLVDLTHNKKYTKNYLEKRLGTTASTSLSDTSVDTSGADFAIIVGTDATITQVNQTH